MKKQFIDKANPYCELKMKLMNPKENIDTFSRIKIQMGKKIGTVQKIDQGLQLA